MGTGHGTGFLQQYSPAQVWGADIAPDVLAFAATYYPILAHHLVASDALHLAFLDRQFDVVCAVEVFEHVLSAETFLTELI